MNQQINTDIEAEQAVLGSLIYRNDLLPQVASILDKAEYFYDVRHQHIYTAMLALDEAESPIDEILIGDYLQKIEKLQASGGRPYLAELIDFVPSSGNVEFYAHIVKEQWTKRELSSLAGQIQGSTNDKGTGSQEQIEKAQGLIDNLAQLGIKKGMTHVKDIAKTCFEKLEVLSSKEDNDGISGQKSGLFDLDEITHGFQDKDLIILAARPAMGKTALALNIAVEIAKTKFVPVFSLEMGKESLVERLLSSIGKIEGSKFKTGRFEGDDWDSLTMASNDIAQLNLAIEDEAYMTYQDIANRCKVIAKTEDIGAVIIDYLQLVHGIKKGQPREQEIAEISRAFKRLAKDLNVPVIALSQLNRGVESRADKRPMMSDLRESGSIEQDADLIMFIYRDEVYNKDSEDVGVAEFIIGKHRNGSTGTVRTQFTGKYTKFSNLQSSYRSKLE